MGKEVKYPVDSASFRRIREEGYLYVDKTEYIHKMTEKGVYYFLARPRRFGKSLFLDTLAEYFKGNRVLFEGLAIDRLETEVWQNYPVMRFNMTGASFLEKDDLKGLISNQLDRQEKEFGFEISDKDINSRFENLIFNISKETGKKVVVLIDEYDAPLSSATGKPELQEIYRSQLHGFYSVLKKTEDSLKFCMLTGVTRYGKVSVFSGLNNLKDITFDNAYAAICGITEEELQQYYMEGIQRLTKEETISFEDALRLLKHNYDGYHFSNSLLDVYNPFSINYAFERLEINDYWCQSGMPTLLSNILKDLDFDLESLNGKEVSEATLMNLSIFKADPIPLFYQTGYLTLKAYSREDKLFTIGYPNREVEKGLFDNILSVYVPGSNDVAVIITQMKRSLRNGHPENFIKILSSFLSDIPSQLHKYVDKYENYYHTIFYCIVKLIGIDIDAEYSTSEGFIDILIKTENYIYVIELKVNGTAKDAIRQIEEKHYVSPFESDSRKIYRIGIGFSNKTHTIDSSIIE